MRLCLGYDRAMRYWMPILAVLLIACLAPSVWAQVNGVPPSVTSFGFGGQPGFQGVPPSVTSLGPRGFDPPHRAPHAPPFQPQHGIHQPGPEHRHHHEVQYYPYYVPYYVPYYAEPYEAPVQDEAVDAQYDSEQDRGGPTIFDRRGSGARADNDYYEDEREQRLAPQKPNSAPAVAADRDTPVAHEVAETSRAPEPSIAPEPSTILVFKDGHKQEVSNYAIVGANLFDLTPGHRLKIALADLDLEATQKANDDQGIDFKLPQLPNGN